MTVFTLHVSFNEHNLEISNLTDVNFTYYGKDEIIHKSYMK